MSPSPGDASDLDDRSSAFHDSLRAALTAGTKLDFGPVNSRASTVSRSLGGVASLSKVDALERLIRDADASPDGVLPDDDLPVDYREASRLFQQTGRIDLVLDSLSLRQTVASELSRALRPAWIYLTLLLILAAIGMAVFARFSAPQVAAMRADMALLPRVTVSSPWISLPQLQMLQVVLPIIAVGLILLAVSTNASAIVAMAFGGRQYFHDRKRQLSANIQHATPEIGNGADERQRHSRWRLLSDNHAFRAANRLSTIRVGLPALIIAVIGGGGVLAYCLILFGPLIVLMRDMTNAAVDAGVWP